jgi:hypothetical protein
MCPHTAIYVCHTYIAVFGHTCTAIYVSSYCCMRVLILLCMCTRTAALSRPSASTPTCVLILLYMCPHAAICVSSYSYMCVPGQRRSLGALPQLLPHYDARLLRPSLRPTSRHTYCYICVRILLCMYPHAALCVLIPILMLLYVSFTVTHIQATSCALPYEDTCTVV